MQFIENAKFKREKQIPSPMVAQFIRLTIIHRKHISDTISISVVIHIENE